MTIHVAVAMMSLDDRVLHVPGGEDGVAACGEPMRKPCLSGSFADIYDRAVDVCDGCIIEMRGGI